MSLSLTNAQSADTGAEAQGGDLLIAYGTGFVLIGGSGGALIAANDALYLIRKVA